MVVLIFNVDRLPSRVAGVSFIALTVIVAKLFAETVATVLESHSFEASARDDFTLVYRLPR